MFFIFIFFFFLLSLQIQFLSRFMISWLSVFVEGPSIYSWFRFMFYFIYCTDNIIYLFLFRLFLR